MAVAPVLAQTPAMAVKATARPAAAARAVTAPRKALSSVQRFEIHRNKSDKVTAAETAYKKKKASTELQIAKLNMELVTLRETRLDVDEIAEQNGWTDEQRVAEHESLRSKIHDKEECKRNHEHALQSWAAELQAYKNGDVPSPSGRHAARDRRAARGEEAQYEEDE